MIIKPKVRGFICINSHPTGCAENVAQQIDYIKAQNFDQTNGQPKNVLIIGASTGYGLASRITAAYGFGAKTLGLFFEKPATEKRTGSAGYYNSAAFENQAKADGLYSKSINGDAFSNQAKEQVIELIKADMGKVDMVVYSLASPRRTDPVTGETYMSTLKPIGKPYTTKSLNTDTKIISEVSVEAANDDGELAASSRELTLMHFWHSTVLLRRRGVTHPVPRASCGPSCPAWFPDSEYCAGSGGRR